MVVDGGLPPPPTILVNGGTEITFNPTDLRRTLWIGRVRHLLTNPKSAF